MRLKSLHLLGFKSFADRTRFEFGGETFTGVVGPNGCGKSNVVDALRWVLGEQRPTSMRGKEMTDVIFKGCASRPSMQVAEATVLLDNSCGSIEDHGAEVAITRRVYKNGEGEYQIDGQRVRLKDVREMLFDTGLGSRGYSVLEQGRIDAVLSANPIDRRRIFEEAAGISRYRQRKHETELRLARVEQDLARLDDVTNELSSRVRSLKVQAGKAERYVGARDEWGRERRRLLEHQLHALSRELERSSAAIGESERELAEIRAGREGSETEIAALEEARGRLTEEVDRLGSEAARLDGDGRALEERRNHLAARVQSWQAAARDEEYRAEELETQLAERQVELEGLRAERSELEQEVGAARGALEERVRGRREHTRRYRELRTRVEEQNAAVLELLHQKTEAANTVRHLEQSRGPLAERTARLEERLSGARAAVEEVRAGEARARAEHDAAEAALSAAEGERAELEERLSELDGELAAAQEERKRLEIEIARRTSTIESLLDREREIADLDGGSRAVWSAVEEGHGPVPAERVHGLLADHLRIGTRHARALDAVLGERARALVVADEDAALAIARWLTGDVEGQAALCVPVAFGAGGEAPPAPPAERVIGPLRAEVECEAGFEGLADALCRGVWLVADVATALELVRDHAGLRCVTPAGELVDAGWLVGGERTLAQGAVGRRASAAELQAQVADLEHQATAACARVDELTARRASSRAELAEAEGRLAERREELADAQSVLHTAEARALDLAESLRVLERERAGADEERERLERTLAEAVERRESTLAGFERENGELNELERQRHAMEEERDQLGKEEGRAHILLTRAHEQLAGLERRLADLERVCTENGAEVERARRLSEEAAESARAGQQEDSDLERSGAELSVARGSLEERLTTARVETAEAERALERARAALGDTTRRLEERSAGLSELRLEQQRLDLSRAEVVRRAEEDLELDPSALPSPDFVPEDELTEPAALAALEARVRELKQQLDRLGPVNLDALSELEEVGGRLEFLQTQSEDLRQSRKALNDTLKRIEEESERLFIETFDQVRENFQRIFRQLFGGGRADVRLAEGEPVLEAGVEIVARPPGREMLPIGLLSGGQRTMTALALLFAVFEARPSPFCVLDEVDAALDDANVERFLGMLSGFRETTQFIVVTHNKGTMAACESLYGVTMQTRGVSRQVSVQLDEVDAFVPEVIGAAKTAGGNGRAAGELDRETGEPVVELQPAHVDAEGDLHGGTTRRSESPAEA